MYELMTLQEIPPKNAVNDFDNDLKDGMRPEFPEEVTEIVIFTLLFTSKCMQYIAQTSTINWFGIIVLNHKYK